MPFLAAASAVTWAANGVLLREPLKPALPADSQAITLPSLSVRVTIVLLKEVLTCAWPKAMFFLTLRRVRAFLGAAMLLRDLLLAGDAHPSRPLAPAGVGLGPLSPNGQPAPVAKPPVGTDLHQPLDVLRALPAQVAL